MSRGASERSGSISCPRDDTELTLAATFSQDRVEEVPSIEVGQRVGRYVVLEHVGRGAMGIVYAAYDPELDRKIALKILTPRRRSGGTHSESERLTSEARALAKLNHPNVVTVHDVGHLDPDTKNRRLYIAMEFVAGMDLGQRMGQLREDPLWRKGKRWRQIVGCFCGAARGLAAAHAAGVIHRDFKPSNVLVKTDSGDASGGGDGADAPEQVRVVDFGLARAPTLSQMREGTDVHETVSPDATALVGTPAYMAPEQLAGDTATEASDQYAFFCSLYEALTGKRPHEQSNVAALAAAKLETPSTWPTDAPPAPRWLQAAVLRGLERDPAKRHPSMSAVVELLERDPAQRLRRAAVAALVVALVVVGAWLTVLLTRPGVVSVTLLDENERPVVPSSATITENTVSIEGHRLQAELSAGTHELVIEADGYETAREPLRVSSGAEHDLVVLMHHEKGMVNLEVHPEGAVVEVDGVDRGSRLANLALDTGRREVEISKLGHVTQRRVWHVSRGSAIDDFVYLPKSLVWKAVAADRNQEVMWIGDVTGDGRSEIAERSFFMLYVRDPWAQKTLATVDIGMLANTGRFTFRDVDGDQIPELLTHTSTSEHGGFAVLSLQDDRLHWKKLWSTDGASDLFPHPEIRGTAERGVDVFFASPNGHRVERRDGRTGAIRWSFDPGGPVVDILVDEHDNAFVVRCDAIIALDPTGKPRWTAATRICRDNAEELLGNRGDRHADTLVDVCTLVDVEDDAHADIICPERRGEDNSYRAWSGLDGKPLWQTEPLPWWFLPRDPVVDVDDDGVADLLLVSHRGPGNVVMLSLGSGKTVWTASGGYPSMLEGEDGPVVVVADGPRISLLDPRTGLSKRTIALPAPLTSPPRTTDLDADGHRDIVVLDDSPSLRAMDFEGATKLEIPLPSVTVNLREPRDQDGDGFADLLACSNGAVIFRGPNILWERQARDPIRSGIAVGDFDHDGRHEVALTAKFDRENAFHIIDAQTGRTIASSTEVFRTIRQITRLDRSPDPDVLALSAFEGQRGLLLMSPKAELLHAFRTETANYGAPGLGDIDGDGQDELIYMPWDDGGTVHVLSSRDLTPVTQWQSEPGSWVPPAVVDLNGDGVVEVLGGYHDGSVRLHDPRSGRPFWIAELGWNKQSWTPVVIDFDGDGELEIVTTAIGDEIAVVSLAANTGEVEARFPGYGNPAAPLVVLDVDNDGVIDVFASWKAGICRLTAKGQQVWCYGTSQTSQTASLDGSPVAFDLDSDGRLELLVPFRGGSLHVLDALTGERRWMFQAPGEGRIELPPVPADVDGDGLYEVFVASHDGTLRALRSPPTPGIKSKKGG